jgi:hypothetical protein
MGVTALASDVHLDVDSEVFESNWFIVGCDGSFYNICENKRRAFARRFVSMDARVKPGHDELKIWVPVLRRITSCCTAPGTRDQLSRKLRSFRLLD